ncbi:hypothetical protein M8J76_002498 [Diaphorina citri]|nr:hypothetical protein M8J75_003544 [Diaphorina citri]KAI5713633.1 hypothetical protein M8J76_002498 [Diaphorina citri]
MSQDELKELMAKILDLGSPRQEDEIKKQQNTIHGISEEIEEKKEDRANINRRDRGGEKNDEEEGGEEVGGE